MASSPSANYTSIPPGVAAEILDAYATAVRPAIGVVLTTTALGSILIPLLITLFYFSSPMSRRQPTFILNVLSILFGIAIAIWNAIIQV